MSFALSVNYDTIFINELNNDTSRIYPHTYSDKQKVGGK